MNLARPVTSVQTASALLLALALTACGGGGDGGTEMRSQAADGESTGTAATVGDPRTFTWWGTPALELYQYNQTCAPQAGCRIPDLDLAVWNATCEPGDRSCYVPLSTDPQVAPLPREEAPPPVLRKPDPATASAQEIEAWNRQCVTVRCMVVE
ncbi:hypothetical protein JI739_02695 [Ramlibacter sp. AW1]|uniref:Secreted protein n=1 Tax=Ramlibacter aurantiacus TaxID=2801330 RepID=A0A936ZE36_9BURK|nr:hypothetical protein [Ramlibacter aurantiacus]MBL0419247.1 hypothetical protein [Ramlibacter aurantiacus]